METHKKKDGSTTPSIELLVNRISKNVSMTKELLKEISHLKELIILQKYASKVVDKNTINKKTEELSELERDFDNLITELKAIEIKKLRYKKGKAKSRFNYDIDPKTGKEIGCEYLVQGGWCNLPKFKRCEDCLRCIDGSKACYVMT